MTAELKPYSITLPRGTRILQPGCFLRLLLFTLQEEGLLRYEEDEVEVFNSNVSVYTEPTRDLVQQLPFLSPQYLIHPPRSPVLVMLVLSVPSLTQSLATHSADEHTIWAATLSVASQLGSIWQLPFGG